VQAIRYTLYAAILACIAGLLTSYHETPTAHASAAPPDAPTARRYSWQSENASWYGPGLIGNTMACGGTLRETSMVVASKTRPCGQRIIVCWHRRCARATVRDRGPYVSGRTMDLGPGVRRALGFSGVHTVRVRRA